MSRGDTTVLDRFRASLAEEYARRFPASAKFHSRDGGALLDGTSHAIRWNDPFPPVVRRAEGPWIEDLDGNRIVDYWQGHFTNLLGHNPSQIVHALKRELADGQGLQSGHAHAIEAETAERICRRTGTECLRFTISGSLGTFYAALVARGFTGRDRVLKVSGGWHGSQPFGLKGVSARGGDFDHVESEGLSRNAGDEVLLTRFNDVEGLRERFARDGDRIACLLLEPMLGAGGGMCASTEFMAEARRLTTHHGALLISDEIITGFRFHGGDASSLLGVRPDLIVLGKGIGGGMPVAAVAGRRDVLRLATRRVGRVKFEGGTFSAHPLSLVATRAMLDVLDAGETELYESLAHAGERLRAEIERAADEEGFPLRVLGRFSAEGVGSSLVYAHAARQPGPPPESADALAEMAHPHIGERLMKSVLMLEGVSGRSTIGAVSAAHGPEELSRTVHAVRAAARRFRAAGLLD